MAILQTFTKRDPSATAGAIATAAATAVGLLFAFSAVYILVVNSFVLPNFERFNTSGVRDQAEVVRRRAEAEKLSQGFLIVSPVLAVTHSSAAMALSEHPIALHRVSHIDWSLMLVVVTVLLGLPFAALAYVRQQSLRLGWPLPWAIFVVVFGPLGWVAYRVHRRWPPASKCEQCDISVPQHLPECLACGEKFLPPAPSGTEIFA